MAIIKICCSNQLSKVGISLWIQKNRGFQTCLLLHRNNFTNCWIALLFIQCHRRKLNAQEVIRRVGFKRSNSMYIGFRNFKKQTFNHWIDMGGIWLWNKEFPWVAMSIFCILSSPLLGASDKQTQLSICRKKGRAENARRRISRKSDRVESRRPKVARACDGDWRRRAELGTFGIFEFFK